MKRSIGIAALLISLQAFAQGVVLSPEQLPAQVRSELAAKVAAARKKDPDAFARLAEVRAKLAELDKNKRGRQAALSPLLRSLGAPALYPLINEVALSAQPRGELKGTAWAAWNLALLEVLGEQRSAETLPIFVAVLESAEPGFELNRAAASGLGNLGTDAAARGLVTLAAGAKRDAVLAGMGTCRRVVVAQTLAAAVATTTDAQALARLAQSLGSVGNSWAWQTPSVPAKSEEGTVRTLSARALVQIVVKGDEHARQAASNALMVVGAQTTPALIQQAKETASEQTAAALEAVAQRFAKNPVH